MKYLKGGEVAHAVKCLKGRGAKHAILVHTLGERGRGMKEGCSGTVFLDVVG